MSATASFSFAADAYRFLFLGRFPLFFVLSRPVQSIQSFLSLRLFTVIPRSQETCNVPANAGLNLHPLSRQHCSSTRFDPAKDEVLLEGAV